MAPDNKKFLDSTTSAERQRLLELLLGDEAVAGSDESRIARKNHPEQIPLSYSQESIWFVEQLEPGSQYNDAFAVRLEGPLNANALEQSLQELTRRHEILRTHIVAADGQPFQVVAAESQVGLKTIDLLSLPESEREALFQRLATNEIQQPFDLATGPILRAALYRLGETEHVFLLIIHQIANDDWSFGVIMRELSVLYDAFCVGAQSPLPDLPIQYADFALWQRDWMENEVVAKQLRYWEAQLSDLSLLQLPIDRPRPPLRSTRGARYPLHLSPDLVTSLRSLCSRHTVTLFMLLLAALKVLLCRYSGQEDIVVGVPIANRDRPETHGLAGMFINMLALRTDLSGNPSFLEVLRRVRAGATRAFSNSHAPFEKLVEVLHLKRDLSRTPLVEVMFDYRNTPEWVMETPSLRGTRVSIDSGVSRFDLVLELLETNGGKIEGEFQYSTELFDAATIARMVANFCTLLAGIVAEQDSPVFKLPLLTAEDQHRLVVEWNHTEMQYPESKCIHELFEAQAKRTPDALAVISQNEQLTYAELDQRANQFARHLRTRGVETGSLVGICVERSAAMLVGIIGILKAGGAYVPLDPEFPGDRLRFMVTDAKLRTVVTQRTLVAKLPMHEAQIVFLDSEWTTDSDLTPGGGLGNLASPASVAYVIYTSGSTGKPKGVVVPHRAVVNFLTSMAREPGLTAYDVLVAVTTLSFDISVLELQLPLTRGAKVVIASRDEATDGHALKRLLEQHRATVMQATPVTWRLLLEAGWTPSTPFKALVGGEALPKDLADQLIARRVELWNMYGPTETTVWSTCARITGTSNGITVGKPIGNTTVRVLDGCQHLCPIGVPGELYIGGAGVTLGYWQQPELTAERFIADPFSNTPGTTLYRTGDRVRWRSDRTLEHLGRLDDQVKLRGLRVELGEIEAIISEHPEVRQAAVYLWTINADDVRIVACCVPVLAGALAPVSLRRHLRTRLPDYMIPQHFLPVEEIPLTPNGKVDRRRLPTPVVTQSVISHYEAPADPIEVAIAAIWTELIKPPRPIGRNDHFFEMGGHSLLALRALRQMEKTFRRKFKLHALFEESLADIGKQIRSGDVHGLEGKTAR